MNTCYFCILFENKFLVSPNCFKPKPKIISTVIHFKPKEEDKNLHTNKVDGKQVPVPHFGVILSWENFETVSEHLKTQNIDFVIEPYIRFKGQVGEQATMFFYDPAGNALEFKAFKNPSQIFAK